MCVSRDLHLSTGLHTGVDGGGPADTGDAPAMKTREEKREGRRDGRKEKVKKCEKINK